jgi:hypothetical protein
MFSKFFALALASANNPVSGLGPSSGYCAMMRAFAALGSTSSGMFSTRVPSGSWIERKFLNNNTNKNNSNSNGTSNSHGNGNSNNDSNSNSNDSNCNNDSNNNYDSNSSNSNNINSVNKIVTTRTLIIPDVNISPILKC